MTGLHPDYGLTDDVRLAALQDAERFGVLQWVAKTHRVGAEHLQMAQGASTGGADDGGGR
jgi:hypothetical protein